MQGTVSGPSRSTLEWLRTPQLHWISGKASASASGRLGNAQNPATGGYICEVAAGDERDADAAVIAARASFDDRRWRGMTPDRRAQILFRIAECIEKDGATLAELETLDGGKPYQAALNGEVAMAARAFRYYAGWCDKIEGETFSPSLPIKFHGMTWREPVGVAAMITPWNGPLVMAAWKLAPALAAGCSCVIKPAELASLSVGRLAELCAEAGLPDGVMNVVFGSGTLIGSALVRHEKVNKVSFTGSTETGKRLVQEASTDLKRISLELGGKSPVIVFADADLAQAIAGAADAIFANAGQVCVAGSRLLVQRPVYDQVLNGVCAAAQALKVGSGFDPQTQLGPLISPEHLSRVLKFVDAGEREGATRLTGGSLLDRPGNFMTPCVFADVRPGMTIYEQEIFGPLLCVVPFDTEAEAIELANASTFGLAASVWTRDVGRAHRCAEALQSGIVWVNAHGIPDMAMPIGGVKQSGWGRETARAGLELYTELKSVMIRVD